jgi:DNA-binding NarL/FixJ family response regulator
MTLVSVPDNSIRQADHPTAEPEPHVSQADPPAESWRVLLVDDDEWTRQLWRDILESYPDMKVVGQAADGREAVALATLHQPDVVLLDVALPYLDGIQATHRIRKACPKTVIIGITGEYAAPVHNAMRAAGAAALVSKDHVMGIHDTIIMALEFFLGKAA